MKCSICQMPTIHENDDTETKHGNNSQPVNSGRCCDSCDCREVIPTRMGLEKDSHEWVELGNLLYSLRMNPPHLNTLKHILESSHPYFMGDVE